MRIKKLKETRQRQAHRMVELRKLKDTAELKGRKRSTVRKDAIECKYDKFIRKVLGRKEIEGYCRHFMIGSSMFWDCLRNGFSMHQAHRIIRTDPDSRITGAAGEEEFRQASKQIAQIHPFAISRQVPWVCATPDFLVIDEQGPKICEVKSFLKPKDALSFFYTVPRRTIIQTWLSMELMGIRRGEIRVNTVDRIAKVITLIGVIELRRTATLFDRSIYMLSVMRWVEFLEEYFEWQGMHPLDGYIQKMMVRLAMRYSEEERKAADREDGEDSLEYLEYRRPPIDCAYVNSSLEFEKTGAKEFKVNRDLFKNYKFIRQSEKVRSILFDRELRREISHELLTNLYQNDKLRLDKLLEEVATFASTTMLLTEKEKEELKKVEKTHPESKVETLLKRLDEKERELIEAKATIVTQTQRISELEAENTGLKAALVAVKPASKRKALARYRRKQEKRQSGQAELKAPLELSETQDTRRKNRRHK